MKFEIRIKNKKYQIEMFELKKDKIKIRVNQKEFVFEDREEKEARAGGRNRGFFKKQQRAKDIKIPIGGVLSKIFVEENDTIKKNQKLAVISAMKMENEVLSPITGKIEKIKAKEGDRVFEGDDFIIIA